jgi:acetyl-CoA acyltransferase
VTMKDIGVMAAGNLMAAAGIGQQLQKQIGQTGIPGLQRRQRLRHRRHRAADGDHGRQGRRGDYGLAVGVEKLSGAGLLAGGSRSPPTLRDWTPQGPLRGGGALDGRIGTETMPGCSPRSAWSTATGTAGWSFELFAKISEKNHAHSTLNPLAAYQKRFTLEQIMNDVMIAYPNTRPMCSANCDGARPRWS